MGNLESPSLQLEYLDDVAIINASGRLKGELPDNLEQSMGTVLNAGYRLVVIDLTKALLTTEGVGDWLKAWTECSSRLAKVATVVRRPRTEYFPTSLPEIYDNREDALRAVRQRD